MAGYKYFADEEVLEAVDVNGYLMGQTVSRFADATARSAAIGTPVAGMLTYVATLGFQIYGADAAWHTIIPPGGTTGQVLAKASGADYDVEWITP